MGEKIKNTIMEILKSDDMRAYLEEMLSGQTTEIVTELQAVEELRFNEEIQGLKNKLNEEQEKNSDLILRNQELESKLEDERKKADSKIQAATIEKQAALSKLEDYEKKYACINTAYSNYKNLPENIKQRVSNIFIRDNIYSFIASVSDWSNIEGIWSFTKRRIIEDENDGLGELVALFVNSFTLFSLMDGSGKYELIKPAIGERFDSDLHSIKGIKTDGQIEKVLLDGIYDTATKRAVFKAVVEIH